jgi:hypothetical protein
LTQYKFERNIRKGAFTTQRRDKWWVFPLISGFVIVIFSVYTTFVLFFGGDSFKFGNYISPIFGIEVPESILTQINWPATLSPALLVIWSPIGFRATCYYMRKVYYRSFFGNPPACSVDGIDFRRGKYTGERWLPLVLNNFHRYFLYTALILLVIHWIEFLKVLQYGVGLGTIILDFDTLFLTLYVTSCHAFRHLIGGSSDCYSCGSIESVQYQGWRMVSFINKKHGLWFWLSLGSIMIADFYIRLLYLGIVGDIIFI